MNVTWLPPGSCAVRVPFKATFSFVEKVRLPGTGLGETVPPEPVPSTGLGDPPPPPPQALMPTISPPTMIVRLQARISDSRTSCSVLPYEARYCHSCRNMFRCVAQLQHRCAAKLTSAGRSVECHVARNPGAQRLYWGAPTLRCSPWNPLTRGPREGSNYGPLLVLTARFKQEPRAPFGLINPVLDEAGGGDIPHLIHHVVHFAQPCGEGLVVLA